MSSRCAVSTQRLGYTNERGKCLQVNNRCLLWNACKTQKCHL